MKKSEIEAELRMLKSDYVRIQGDMDKMETIGNGKMTKSAEKQLVKLEEQIAVLNHQLDMAD